MPNTTRGTNYYIHCSHLIYLYDQHVNPLVDRWLEDSTGVFNDAYALTELIQWGLEVKGKTKGANHLVSTKPKEAGAIRRLVIKLTKSYEFNGHVMLQA